MLYSLCIVCFCFTPQPQLPTGVETPGIQTFGRLVFLLTPFNSLWNLGEVTSFLQLFWIFLQNALNILLLFPLIFQLLYLIPALRKTKRVIFFSFLVSWGIECTQVVLDFFAKRLKCPLALPFNFPASLSYTCSKKKEACDFV